MSHLAPRADECSFEDWWRKANIGTRIREKGLTASSFWGLGASGCIEIEQSLMGIGLPFRGCSNICGERLASVYSFLKGSDPTHVGAPPALGLPFLQFPYPIWYP
jgi:hypothetical protein